MNTDLFIKLMIVIVVVCILAATIKYLTTPTPVYAMPGDPKPPARVNGFAPSGSELQV